MRESVQAQLWTNGKFYKLEAPHLTFAGISYATTNESAGAIATAKLFEDAMLPLLGAQSAAASAHVRLAYQ